MVFPETSITLALRGTVKLPEGPTAFILAFSIRISPFSITVLPFMVIILAPFNKAIPSGISFSTLILTLNSTGLKVLSFLSFLSFSDFSLSPSFFSSLFFSLAFFAAVILSLKVFASSRSYIKWALPIDQCTFFASEDQAGNCPPISVSFQEGN